MHWRQKSTIQRACALLPVGKERVYYLLQRRFGRLSQPHDPTWLLSESARMAQRLEQAGIQVQGAQMMEVGTGWRVDMPVGFFLCGAGSIVTVDLHRYLKPDLALETIAFIRENRDHVAQIFYGALDREELNNRLDRLEHIDSFSRLQEVTRIRYLAPCDAARPDLPDHSIDIQFSYTVFEHIPGPVLVDILKGANRLLAPNGAAFHHVDLSDHFAHDDHSISSINFLQFSDREWHKLGENQFAYHNRLRVNDYEQIYSQSGHRILQWETGVDRRALEELRNGFPLHEKYQGLSHEVLSTTNLQVLSGPAS